MAKKKIVRRKKASTKTNKGIGIEFHSWTFFLFLLFILIATLILVAQQMGMKFF